MWHELPLFYRIMCVIGIAVTVLGIAVSSGALVCWIDIKLSHRQAEQKSQAAKPVNGIDWLPYDSKARIKEQCKEPEDDYL